MTTTSNRRARLVREARKARTLCREMWTEMERLRAARIARGPIYSEAEERTAPDTVAYWDLSHRFSDENARLQRAYHRLVNFILDNADAK